MPSQVSTKLTAARDAVQSLADELASPEDAAAAPPDGPVDAKMTLDVVALRESADRAGKALGARSANSPLDGKATRVDAARPVIV